MYEETQDPSVGALANYKKVLTQIVAGKQPGGANTPVYVSEFNTNWAFFKDCCRNDNTYASQTCSIPFITAPCTCPTS